MQTEEELALKHLKLAREFLQKAWQRKDNTPSYSKYLFIQFSLLIKIERTIGNLYVSDWRDILRDALKNAESLVQHVKRIAK